MDVAAANRLAVAVLDDEVSNSEIKALWVFAYGSLCWKPGFEFHKAVTGYVQGFERRFWQGNTTHRGTEDKVYTFFLFKYTPIILSSNLSPPFIYLFLLFYQIKQSNQNTKQRNFH